MYPIHMVTSTSPQCILDSDRTVVAPVNFERTLKIEGIRGLPLEITIKCKFVAQTTSESLSRSLDSWQALPVLQMALLPPMRKLLLVSLPAGEQQKSRRKE
jgi:hypothetical protein